MARKLLPTTGKVVPPEQPLDFLVSAQALKKYRRLWPFVKELVTVVPEAIRLFNLRGSVQMTTYAYLYIELVGSSSG